MHPILTPVWITWLVVAMLVLAAATVGLAAYGRARWAASTRALIAELETTRRQQPVARYDAAELEGLPRRCSATFAWR